jgi:Fibronectin type III domain
MARVKLDFKGLAPADKVIRAEQIVTSLTGNPHFPTPNPPLTAVTSALNGLRAALVETQQARHQAFAKTVAQNESEDALDQVMRQLAAYIDNVSAGDETMIRSAGVSVRSATIATGDDFTAPTALSVSEGDHDGELDLHWNSVKRARSYIIERSADPPTDSSWSQVQVVTRSSATISGLTRGAKYWFRVAAINSGGQSGWSDPVMKIAP